MATETSRPWPKPIGDATVGTPWDGALHRLLWGASLGDGIVGDMTGQSLSASVSEFGPAVILQPGIASVRGHEYELAGGTKSFALPTVPGSGNKRIDRLVLHYDPAATTPETMITARVVSGTPAASPVPPTLTRAEGEGWMVPIAGWRRVQGTTSGVDQWVDLRTWVGPQLTIADPAALPADAPLGTTAVEQASAGRWWRQLVGGALEWVSDTPRLAAYLGSTITPLSGSRTSRIGMVLDGPALGGMSLPSSQRIVVPYSGRYRIEVQVRVTVPSGGAANNVLSVVSADGSAVSAGYGYVDADIATTTISHVRPSVDLAAGQGLTWDVTTSAGGGLTIGAGAAFTNISVSKVG